MGQSLAGATAQCSGLPRELGGSRRGARTPRVVAIASRTTRPPGPTLSPVTDDTTTPTDWDQSEGPALDSPALGAIALVVAVLSALCSLTYLFSVFTYLGAAVALPLGVLARGVPRSHALGNAAIAVAAVACLAATAVLISVGG